MRSPLPTLMGSLRLFALAFVWTIFSPALAQEQTVPGQHTATFTLFDTRTDLPIIGFDPIPHNATLNLNQLPLYINIRANLSEDAGSVKFSFRNRDTFHIENAAPFALFGDTGGDYKDGRIPVGSYTLTATPFAKKKGRGAAGAPFSVSFTVVREGAALQVTSFVLVDAETNEDLFEIEDQMRLDLANLPPNLNIRAEVSGPSKSLKWTLTPKQRRQTDYLHVENSPPFALFGDDEGDYFSGALEKGEYVLSATAFRHPHAKGSKGIPHAVKIQLVNEAPPSLQHKSEEPAVRKGTTLHPDSGLEPAYPNPFNPTTTIRFSLSEPTHARLVIYDLLGRQIKTLVDSYREAGSHEVIFEAGDLPSGAYLYRLTTPEYSTVRKFTLSK